MKLEITSRDHDLSDFLQNHIEERIQKIDKYTHGEGDAHIILERGASGQSVEVTVHALHKTMHAREEGEHVRECIDKSLAKIESQIRKHKEKMTERRP